MKRLAILLAALAVVSAAPACAEGLEIEPVIGGAPLHCTDFRGVVVRTLRVTDLGDVGRAKIITRMPIIMLDSDRLATLPAKMQIFFYIHECAHHALGHHFNITTSNESDADCWSVKYGRESGLLARTDVEGFAPYFANSKGSAFGHLPGPEREIHLLECYDDPAPTESAWNN